MFNPGDKVVVNGKIGAVLYLEELDMYGRNPASYFIEFEDGQKLSVDAGFVSPYTGKTATKGIPKSFKSYLKKYFRGDFDDFIGALDDFSFVEYAESFEDEDEAVADLYDWIDSVYDQVVEFLFSLQFPLKIYRRVRASSFDKINLNELGQYYSLDEDAADTYWGNYGGDVYLIEGEIDVDAIDWMSSIIARLNPNFDFGYQEAEVRLKKGALLHNVYIKKDGLDKRVSVKDVKAFKRKLAITDFEALDSISKLKFNEGLWRSEKQAEFLLNNLPPKQDPDALAWMEQMGLKGRAYFLMKSLSNYGHQDISKIRMVGEVIVVDGGGLVATGTVKIKHPNKEKGIDNFTPDWDRFIEISFLRKKEPVIWIDLDEKEDIKRKEIEERNLKAKEELDLLYQIPGWEQVDILRSFESQLKEGWVLSPKQKVILQKFIAYNLFDDSKEKWRENMKWFNNYIVNDLLPYMINAWGNDVEWKDVSMKEERIEELRKLREKLKDLGVKKVNTETDYIRDQVENSILHDVGVRHPMSWNFFDDLSDQYLKAMKSKNPTKKAVDWMAWLDYAVKKLK